MPISVPNVTIFLFKLRITEGLNSKNTLLDVSLCTQKACLD